MKRIKEQQQKQQQLMVQGRAEKTSTRKIHAFMYEMELKYFDEAKESEE